MTLEDQRTAIQQRECSFCFKRKTSEKGLFFSTDDLIAVCYDHIKLLENIRSEQINSRFYVNIKKIAVDKSKSSLFSHVQRGFEDIINESKTEYQIHESAYDSESGIFYTEGSEEFLKFSECFKILNNSHNFIKLRQKQLNDIFLGEQLKVYRNAKNLYQIPNPPIIDLNKNIKCKNCELTSNLWLNLSDGSILCGRRYYDGSGGNNHAVEHFKQTGHPLCVKIGSLDENSADVYAYDVDDMVLDPQLDSHLSYFGIKRANKLKTEKTQNELEYQMNKDINVKKSLNLIPPSKGLVGLTNIGNSCYISSLFQCIVKIPSLLLKYSDQRDHIFKSNYSQINENIDCQIAKIFDVLTKSDLSDLPKYKDSDLLKIKPDLFKLSISKLSGEFGNSKQQDVSEFFLYLISWMNNPDDVYFRSSIADIHYHTLIASMLHEEVSYTLSESYILDLDMIPNHEKKYEFEFILSNYLENQVVEFKNDDGKMMLMNKFTKLAYLPEFLFICVNRFSIIEHKDVQKVNDNILFTNCDPLCHMFDFSFLLADKNSVNIAIACQDLKDKQYLTLEQENALLHLNEMGFNNPGLCQEAIKRTTNIEECTQLILEWMNSGYSPNESDSKSLVNKIDDISNQDYDNIYVSDENISLIISLGFDHHNAIHALKKFDNSVDEALEYLMQKNDKNNSVDEYKNNLSLTIPLTPQGYNSIRSKSTNFMLKAFIVHRGTSTEFGHYLSYVRDDKYNSVWYEFNDEKVSLCKMPPFGQAYMMMFKRQELL